MPVTLTPDGYRKRVADAVVARALAAMPAVVIEGPKGCGKTWTGRRFARSEVLFDRDLNARRSVSLVPGLALEGEEPRLLDEWQLAPEVWNQVRRASDEGHRTGRFILTGSAAPADDITRHSGAGRVSRVRMRPMSLLETGESTGDVSLEALLEGEPVAAGRPDADFQEVLEALCRGGWPRLLGRPVADAQLFLDDYIAELCRTDVRSADGVARDPGGVARLIASIARNVATTASFSKLAAEAAGDRPLNRTTATEYLRSLERLFVVEDVPAWRSHLRSRATLQSSPKRHFVDPSLATAALGATPARLLADLEALRIPVRIAGRARPAHLQPGHQSLRLPLPRQQQAGGRCHRRGSRRALAGGGGQARQRRGHRAGGPVAVAAARQDRWLTHARAVQAADRHRHRIRLRPASTEPRSSP